MKYTIILYNYKLEEYKLSINTSLVDGVSVLTTKYKENTYEGIYLPEYTDIKYFINYIDMLYHILDIFTELYKNVIFMNFETNPPDWMIIDIFDLNINQFIKLKNTARVEMVYGNFLYHYTLEIIKSKINKAMFQLLIIKIKKENIKHLKLFLSKDIYKIIENFL